MEIIESNIYEKDKIKMLSEINQISNINNKKDTIIKTLKEKIKDLNSCNRVFELKIKELLNKNKSLLNKFNNIKEIIIQ